MIVFLSRSILPAHRSSQTRVNRFKRRRALGDCLLPDRIVERGNLCEAWHKIVTELEAKRSMVEGELTRLDNAISVLGDNRVSSRRRITNNRDARPRRTMSAAARKRIAIAQRACWAAWKAKRKRSA